MRPEQAEAAVLPGFDPLAALVLHHLVGRDDDDEASVAETLGLTARQVRGALDLLERDRLVVRVDGPGARPGGRARWAALPPRSGLATLLARRRAELAGWEQQLDALEAEYRRASARHPASSSVEHVSGTEQVGTVYAQLLAAARHEVLHFVRPPYMTAAVDAVRDVVEDGPAPGVRLRSIYEVASFDDPISLRTAEEGTAQGGEVRLLAGVPLKLVLVDRSVALLPVDPDDPAAGSVVVRTPGIVTSLLALFDALWAQSAPMARWGPRSPSVDLSARTRDVLNLMAAGLTDDAIARTLGVSRRTVQKTVSELAEALGARTRFQVALAAAERGLVGLAEDRGASSR